jgi:hypothetical protein
MSDPLMILVAGWLLERAATVRCGVSSLRW